MKLKSMVLLALALGCGLVAMLGVQQILTRGEQDPDAGKIKVLVARMEIEPGTRLDETNVAFEGYPEEKVPQGAVLDAKQYEERATKVRLYPGEVVLEKKLGPKGASGVSTNIEKGMRVVTVPVNATSSNSGMINPGDRIDILVTYKIQKQQALVSRTKTVLQYVKVFALDRVRDAEDETNKGAKAENLSVIVTPEQATLLNFAMNKGTLQMSLRSVEDKEELKNTFIDDEMFDSSEPGKGPAVAEVGDEDEDEDDRSTRDFREFVEKSDSPAEPEKKAEPEKNTWTIEIWEGPTKIVEHVDLPGTAPEHATTPTAPVQPAKDKPTSPSA